MTIRPATVADLKAINDIYNYFVVHATCTYQLEPSTEQERMTEGYYRKSDLGWNGGGGVGWWGGFAALGASGYSDTAIGQIIVLAYLDAYKKLVTQLGGVSPMPAAAPPPRR